MDEPTNCDQFRALIIQETSIISHLHLHNLQKQKQQTLQKHKIYLASNMFGGDISSLFYHVVDNYFLKGAFLDLLALWPLV